VKYNLTLLLNGETKKKRTENIKDAILSLKPEVLYTEVYVIVSKVGSKDKIERNLNLIQGKKLFNNEDFLDVFILNLLLDY
jgi:hypothetical protein